MAAVEIPQRLNATPMQREVRRHFYAEAASAMQAALDDGNSRIRIS